MTIRRIIFFCLSAALVLALACMLFLFIAVNHSREQAEENYQRLFLEQVAATFHGFNMALDLFVENNISKEAYSLSLAIANQIEDHSWTWIDLDQIRQAFGIEDYEIFLVNRDGLVVNTTYPPDRGLLLLTPEHPDFSARLKSIINEGGFWNPGLTRKTFTDEAWIFTYYQPEDREFLVELGLPAARMAEVLTGFSAQIDALTTRTDIESISIVSSDMITLFGEKLTIDEQTGSYIRQALETQETIIADVSSDNGLYRRYFFPIEPASQHLGKQVVVLTVPSDLISVAVLNPFFAVVITLICLAFLAFYLFLKKRLVSPIDNLTKFTRHLTVANFAAEPLVPAQPTSAPEELILFQESLLGMLGELQKHHEEISAQYEELALASREIATANERLEALLNSFSGIHRLDRNVFLEHIGQQIVQLIPEAEKGIIFEQHQGVFRPVASIGYDPQQIAQLSFTADEAFGQAHPEQLTEVTTAVWHVTSEQLEELCRRKQRLLAKLGIAQDFTMLYAPVLVGGRRQGLIMLDSFQSADFSPVSHSILRYYASLVSEFLSRILYQERMEETYLQIVTALISAIEIKDRYTIGHSQRVREYSRRIAEAMQLSPSEIERIEMAALLHDVGKIGIPEDILRKPGPLTEEEYALVKKHPEFSQRIIEKINDFAEISNLVYLHHERYDGNGYPLGLSADQIPLGAQIILVADAFDAMTSQRSYREPMPRQKALDILNAEKGKQFHPGIVDVAIEKVFN